MSLVKEIQGSMPEMGIPGRARTGVLVGIYSPEELMGWRARVTFIELEKQTTLKIGEGHNEHIETLEALLFQLIYFYGFQE